MALAQLSIDLVAKVASFENDLKRAARAAEDQSSKINASLGALRGGLAGLAGGFSVGFIAGLIRDTNDAVDALNDVSDATGSTVENISALEDVARRTGASLDTVSGVLVKFNQVLASADPDSKAAKSLEAIGLSAKDLKQLDPAEALRQTAVALAQFAEDGEKARLVQDLFGKSVREASPFLKDLAEQGRLNATVTADQVAAAEKFNKELFKFNALADDLARSTIGELVKGINDTADAFRRGAAEGKNFLEIGWDRYRQNIKDFYATDPAERLLEINREIADTMGSLAGARVDNRSGYQARIDALKTEKENLLEVQRLQQRSNLAQGGEARPTINLPKDDPNASKRDAAARKLQQDAERELQDQRERDLRAGELRNRLAGERYAEELNRLKGLDDLFASIAEKERDRLQLLLDDTPTGMLEKQLRTVEFLKEAFEGGKISVQQYGEAVLASVGNVSKESEKANDFAKDLGLSFSSAFEDAVVEGEKFSEVLKGLGDDITRILTRKLVTEPLGDAITGLVRGGTGGSGGFLDGLLGSLFSFSGGGYTGAGSRSGGVDGKGGFPAILHPNETVLDHSMGQGVGSKVTVNVINQGGGLAVQSQQQRTGADGGLTIDVIVRAVEAGMADNVANRSGPLSRALEGGYGLRPSMG